MVRGALLGSFVADGASIVFALPARREERDRACCNLSITERVELGSKSRTNASQVLAAERGTALVGEGEGKRRKNFSVVRSK